VVWVVRWMVGDQHTKAGLIEIIIFITTHYNVHMGFRHDGVSLLDGSSDKGGIKLY